MDTTSIDTPLIPPSTAISDVTALPATKDTPAIGRLERVALREVWKHEAYDFTQWLQQNIDVLNATIDLDLVNVEREQAAGAFSIDLVAEDEGGGTVIIENQLEKSNHDHLGKLITYLSVMGAKAAVWLVSDPRPEHVGAVAWLNESSSAAFYMIKVEAVRIGTSPAAPLLTLIVGPSEESKNVGHTKKEIAERHGLRKRWWIQLVERSAKVSKLHAHITPSDYSWIGTTMGLRGLNLNYVVGQNDCAVELYIDRGKDGEQENLAIFDQLESHRVDIDNAFAAENTTEGALTWQRLEGKRACRIRYTQPGGGYRADEEHWPLIQDGLIAAMNRLEKALRPFVKQLNLNL